MSPKNEIFPALNFQIGAELSDLKTTAEENNYLLNINHLTSTTQNSVLHKYARNRKSVRPS